MNEEDNERSAKGEDVPVLLSIGEVHYRFASFDEMNSVMKQVQFNPIMILKFIINTPCPSCGSYDVDVLGMSGVNQLIHCNNKNCVPILSEEKNPMGP